jgi:hypothetical protein
MKTNGQSYGLPPLMNKPIVRFDPYEIVRFDPYE